MTNPRNIIRYFFSFLFCVVLMTSAKSQENDFQIWSQVSTKYKIGKKIRLSSSMGIRSYENTRLIKKYYADLGLKYKFNKRISMAAKYRFSDYHFYDVVSTHRLSLDAQYSFKKWGRARFGIRERVEYEWLVNNPVNIGDDSNLRSKIEMTYDIKKSKIEPYVSVEHYLGLNGKRKGLTKLLRLTFGAEMPVNKWSDLAILYRIQKQVYIANPTTAYIFMINYSIDIN